MDDFDCLDSRDGTRGDRTVHVGGGPGGKGGERGKGRDGSRGRRKGRWREGGRGEGFIDGIIKLDCGGSKCK